ncbi:MAG: glycosyltransferase [Acidobacteria bacterium]|nr:glycosyltransferase [Acidobacteriota bacterium]MBV9478441.1 glycosyltransferase [Acidobacteriota bacterium]
MNALATVVLILWLLALGRTILNLLFVPRLRAASPARTPLVSVIVPARDEERAIGRSVRALLAQTYPALEVIVVNDRSVDDTSAILAAIDDPRLVVVKGEDPPTSWLGKPWALHQGSLRARGELLLFVDADVLYEEGAVSAAVAQIESRGAALLALFPRFVMRGAWEHIAMPNLPLTAFVVLPLWLANRTRIRTLAIGGGPGNLIRRADYDAAGGHEALRDAVVDDIALARLVRRAGRRTEIVRADDFVSVRMYHGLREIVGGFTKNFFATLSRNYVAAALSAVLLPLMWIAPYAGAFAGNRIWLAALIAMTLVRVVLFAALGYSIASALFGAIPMALVWLWILVRSTWKTGIRRQLDWRGRTYDASRTRFGAD